MGFIHYIQDDKLTTQEAESLIDYENKRILVSMDYVRGRACKFTIFRESGKLFINKNWFDHSEYDLEKLLGESNDTNT